MRFQVGDRVQAVRHGYADVLPGDTGTVMNSYYGECAVYWDRDVGGHACTLKLDTGVIPYGYGTFEWEGILEFLPTEEEQTIDIGDLW